MIEHEGETSEWKRELAIVTIICGANAKCYAHDQIQMQTQIFQPVQHTQQDEKPSEREKKRKTQQYS